MNQKLMIRGEYLPLIEKHFMYGGCVLYCGRGVGKKQIVQFQIDNDHYNHEEYGWIWVAFPGHIEAIEMRLAAYDEFEIEWRIPIPDDLGLSWEVKS